MGKLLIKHGEMEEYNHLNCEGGNPAYVSSSNKMNVREEASPGEWNGPYERQLDLRKRKFVGLIKQISKIPNV